MNLKLKRIAPLQAGKMIGVFYALISLIFVPFFLFFMTMGGMAARQSGNATVMPLMFGMGIGAIVFVPVIYGVMGFVFGALGALVYNLLAKPLGGFELEFETNTPPPPVL